MSKKKTGRTGFIWYKWRKKKASVKNWLYGIKGTDNIREKNQDR